MLSESNTVTHMASGANPAAFADHGFVFYDGMRADLYMRADLRARTHHRARMNERLRYGSGTQLRCDPRECQLWLRTDQHRLCRLRTRKLASDNRSRSRSQCLRKSLLFF